MAIMIPSDGGYFDPRSKEKEMFEALSKLPQDYYVFHSYRLAKLVPDKGLNENEIDFLVFNPHYGCLFIECKNRTLRRIENGQWQFLDLSNGNETWKDMHDPFDQAFSGQHNLFNSFRENEAYRAYKDLINGCKCMVAVWLPKYTKREIEGMSFGVNAPKEVIMTREAMLYPDETLKQVSALMERMNRVHIVCKYEEEIIDASGYRHTLSPEDAMTFFKNVLCPTFKTIIDVKKDYEDTYLELLQEQYVVLNFLAHQRTAAISGAGGTGKTLVAVQRARLLSEKGERVLFLCYNHNLCVDLAQRNKEIKNVEFYTLDSLACKKCNISWDRVNYYDLKEVLEKEILDGTFEYKHIIVDEGQDFGKRNDSESNIKSDILELLSDYGAGVFDHSDTSFFIFYDKNQMVNTKTLPVYLQNVDSKLTLYRNCRNTKLIAETAYSLLSSAPVMHERAWNGEASSFVFYSSKDELFKRLDNIIDDLSKNSTSSSRVLISCADSLKYSAVQDRILTESDGRSYSYKSNGKKIRLYTCPTFKGLEADDVIIIDINNKTFEKDNCDFYVAASRAKKRLFILIDKNKVDFDKVITERFPNAFPAPNKEKQLAMVMHGLPK